MSRAREPGERTAVAAAGTRGRVRRRSGRAPSRADGARRARATTSPQAAIAVADAEGIDAVSMRRVAAELGLGTMTLYHYVRGKDELLDLMSDAILGGQLVDEAELPTGWRAGAARDRPSHARQLRAPPVDRRRDAPAPAARSRAPTRCATSTSRSRRVAEHGPRRPDDRWRSSRSSTTTSSASSCAPAHRRASRRAARSRPSPGGCRRSSTTWQRSSRPAPSRHLHAREQANRAAGGRDEDLAEMALDRGTLRARARAPARRRRGEFATPSSGVVEDDAERRAPARAHRGHAVAHVRPVVAAGALHRAVAGREDQEGAALEVDDVRA